MPGICASAAVAAVLCLFHAFPLFAYQPRRQPAEGHHPQIEGEGEGAGVRAQHAQRHGAGDAPGHQPRGKDDGILYIRHFRVPFLLILPVERARKLALHDGPDGLIAEKAADAQREQQHDGIVADAPGRVLQALSHAGKHARAPENAAVGAGEQQYAAHLQHGYQPAAGKHTGKRGIFCRVAQDQAAQAFACRRLLQKEGKQQRRNQADQHGDAYLYPREGQNDHDRCRDQAKQAQIKLLRQQTGDLPADLPHRRSQREQGVGCRAEQKGGQGAFQHGADIAAHICAGEHGNQIGAGGGGRAPVSHIYTGKDRSGGQHGIHPRRPRDADQDDPRGGGNAEAGAYGVGHGRRQQKGGRQKKPRRHMRDAEGNKTGDGAALTPRPDQTADDEQDAYNDEGILQAARHIPEQLPERRAPAESHYGKQDQPQPQRGQHGDIQRERGSHCRRENQKDKQDEHMYAPQYCLYG